MWLQVAFEVAATEADAAEQALLALGALAVTFSDPGDAPILEPAPGEAPLWPNLLVDALLPADTAPKLVEQRLSATFGHLPILKFSQLADRNWLGEWREALRPIHAGRRLWICPPGIACPEPGAVVVELEPGLAFGTGTHPTTAMCLAWLADQELVGRTVLDWGCGSGVLAVSALALGAASAVALDIDPQALVATRENAAKSGLSERISVERLAGDVAGAFDIVVANILSGPLIGLAPGLAPRARADGLIVLAGMLERQADEVARAYRPWFDIGPAAEREGWTLLAGRRRAE